MSQSPQAFANFDEIAAFLDTQSIWLCNKARETRFLSFLFRQSALFSGITLSFFAICMLVTLCNGIELNLVNQWLISLKAYNPGIVYWAGGLLLLSLLEACFCGVDVNYKTKKFWCRKIEALLLFFVIQCAVAAIVVLALHSAQPVMTGAVISASVTVASLLVNHSLGFTRRNERYQLFSYRAQRLAIQFRSLKRLKVPFGESHIRELATLYEALSNSKHQDTVSDSFYLLKQLEKKIAA